MKKLLILTAALLFGVGSVFAQDAWEVKAIWSFASGSDCLDVLSTEYGFLITLYIYDDANGNQVTDNNTYQTEGWQVYSTIFPGSKTKVQAYCNEDHDFTPSFSVDVTVSLVHLSTQEVACTTFKNTSGWSCSDFSNGDVLIEGITFN